MAQLQVRNGKLLVVGGRLATNCCCDGEECDACISTPQQLQLVIAGVGGTCTGGTCGNINGTYILDIVAPDAPGDCEWRYTLSPTECTGSDELEWVGVILTPLGGTSYDLIVFIWGTPLSNYLWWEDTLSSKPDCSAWSGLSVTEFIDLGSCSVSGATATITAL